ncbi:MAG: DegT/DnrJ/EryC1/StrS family aminotransferase [Magnetococcales bacterium]|nr:DegT/DnrJ/EryC1/StrS family aminotransferase [Magnetococcales bacterium]
MDFPVAGPWITQKEIDYAADAAANGWYGQANDYIHRFEGAFRDYLGVKHAVSLPSCTSAIHLSLAALGVGPGDEVIVPDVTWIASAAPVHYVGAKLVFADIDGKSWCLSPASFEACITPRTRAVIPVDLYGGMPDMTAIRHIAKAHDIHIVEDAAQAIGSAFQGKKAGSFGDTGVFSFHGSKTLTTGEGGMLVTDDEELFQRVMFLRDHGRPPGDKWFFNTEVAFKYKMSPIQAALGLAQIERVEELVNKKREIFAWYRQRLEKIPGVTLNPEPEGVFSSYWMVSILIDPGRSFHKRELMAKLAQVGVDTRPFFHPLSGIPAFENTPEAQRARENNRVSHTLAAYGVNLPSALCLSHSDVETICDRLEIILAEQGLA